MNYLSPLQALSNHVDKCETCKTNSFGLCSLGHRLIGEIARLRHDDGQLELLPITIAEKPLVKMQTRQILKQNVSESEVKSLVLSHLRNKLGDGATLKIEDIK